MAGKKAPKMAPGEKVSGSGKTGIRTTMTPVFGARAGKRTPKRGGRGR